MSLASVTVDGPEYNLFIPKETSSDKFLGFSTSVDGRPVAARMEQKVFAKGVERTSELRDLGLPLAPYLRGMGERLDRRPPEARAKLIARLLATRGGRLRLRHPNRTHRSQRKEVIRNISRPFGRDVGKYLPLCSDGSVGSVDKLRHPAHRLCGPAAPCDADPNALPTAKSRLQKFSPCEASQPQFSFPAVTVRPSQPRWQRSVHSFGQDTSCARAVQRIVCPW